MSPCPKGKKKRGEGSTGEFFVHRSVAAMLSRISLDYDVENISLGDVPTIVRSLSFEEKEVMDPLLSEFDAFLALIRNLVFNNSDPEKKRIGGLLLAHCLSQESFRPLFVKHHEKLFRLIQSLCSKGATLDTGHLSLYYFLRHLLAPGAGVDTAEYLNERGTILKLVFPFPEEATLSFVTLLLFIQRRVPKLLRGKNTKLAKELGIPELGQRLYKEFIERDHSDMVEEQLMHSLILSEYVHLDELVSSLLWIEGTVLGLPVSHIGPAEFEAKNKFELASAHRKISMLLSNPLLFREEQMPVWTLLRNLYDLTSLKYSETSAAAFYPQVVYDDLKILLDGIIKSFHPLEVVLFDIETSKSAIIFHILEYFLENWNPIFIRQRATQTSYAGIKLFNAAAECLCEYISISKTALEPGPMVQVILNLVTTADIALEGLDSLPDPLVESFLVTAMRVFEVVFRYSPSVLDVSDLEYKNEKGALRNLLQSHVLKAHLRVRRQERRLEGLLNDRKEMLWAANRNVPMAKPLARLRAATLRTLASIVESPAEISLDLVGIISSLVWHSEDPETERLRHFMSAYSLPRESVSRSFGMDFVEGLWRSAVEMDKKYRQNFYRSVGPSEDVEESEEGDQVRSSEDAGTDGFSSRKESESASDQDETDGSDAPAVAGQESPRREEVPDDFSEIPDIVL